MDLERQVGLRGNGSVVVPDRRAMIRSIVLEARGDGQSGARARRRRRGARSRSRPLRSLPRAEPPPFGLPLPGRSANSGFLGRALRAARARSARSLAERNAHSRSLRTRPRAVAAARFREVEQRGPLELPARRRRAPQPLERPAHDAGRLPRRGGRPARSGRQGGRAARRVRAHAPRGAATAGTPRAAAVHGKLGRAGRNDGVAVVAPARVPRGPRRLEQEAARGALLRARRPRLESGFRRIDLRQLGRSAPARERRRPRRRALDRTHRLRDPRAAPHPPEEERPRACRT